MNRLDFAQYVVKLTLKECEEAPNASEEDLAFATKVLTELLPRTGSWSMRRQAPAFLRVVQRLPPIRRPTDLQRVLKPVLDDDDFRRVVKELDATNRTARGEWAQRMKLARAAHESGSDKPVDERQPVSDGTQCQRTRSATLDDARRRRGT